MSTSPETKDKLKSLRDRLATEVPRARTRSNVPPELAQRLTTVLDRVNGAYLLLAAKSAAPEGLADMVDDVLVEAHLALHELERCSSSSSAPSLKPRAGGAERRVHERYDVEVWVQLLSHCLTSDDILGTALSTETSRRPARNVSLGGIFVAIPRDELPQIGVGHVVHVSVGAGDAAPFKARAVVMRRDPSGLGLSWLQDSDRLRKQVEALLSSLRRGR